MAAFARRSTPPCAAWAAIAVESLIDADTLALVAAAIDRATLLRLMTLFIEDTDGRLERLQSLAAAGDLARLAQEAHALKGSAASMGAAAIADAAGELEQRAWHGRGDWQGSVAALRAVAERSYPSLLGWCERSA
jgi:HPt (histidine-containing phosphotransfer) domain-containing protein